MPNQSEDIASAIYREIREHRVEMRERLDRLEQQLRGVGGMLTLIYGKQIDHEERIEKIEASE